MSWRFTDIHETFTAILRATYGDRFCRALVESF